MEYKIIDAHIHPFAEPSRNTSCFGSPDTFSALVRDLEDNGISGCCGSVIKRGPATFEDVLKLNREALALRDARPGFYEPGIHVHADDPEGSCRELETMRREHDVRWIGELVHYMLKTGNYDSPGMFKIYETARDLAMPVNIHCSDLTVIENVVKNFPALNVVMAHPEDGENRENRYALMKRYDNLFLDISGTGLFRWRMLKHGVDLCGSEKFLFGTDFPICNPAMYVAGVMAEPLTGSERENIFSKNFLRLVGRL